jgi:penicillin amidase/acyl-homoserine-lactone acylase
MKFLRRNWKRILGGMIGLLALAAFYIFWPVTEDLSALAHAGDEYHVRILRDTWGVPHIFGVTDADAAFGLAYANAEDDFLTIQQLLAAGRGQLAALNGPDSAPVDYMVQLLRVWDVVNEKYDSDLSPETRAIVEAYAAGLNRYAGLHPKEALPGLFPVTGKDVVASAVFKTPLFFGLDKTLTELFADKRQKEVSPRPQTDLWDLENPASLKFNIQDLFGSNVFAVSPARSVNGETFLNVNSHQPWTGPVAWYEAHVHSEQGWDMVGGTFPGVPVIIHGHNRNLGWAFTVNHPDLTDVYVLDINPQNPNQYKFDGQWRDLEVRSAPITVKLIGRLKWTVKQEVLWSVYGPVVRRLHGTYAIRYAGMGTLGIYEQLYRMNKARDFAEWQAAMRLGQLPMFNVGYADRAGNIFYVYNASLPIRAEGYDWKQYLPGDTSQTLWTDYLPFDQLPQVLNPPSGFIQNSNSNPFRTTLGAGNPAWARYSLTFGIETQMSNRALRSLELFGADPSITAADFLRIKYDLAYSSESDIAQWRQMLLAADLPAEAQAAKQVLQNWDLRTNPENPGAALMILTLQQLLANHPGAVEPSLLVGDAVDLNWLTESFVKAAGLLTKNFGRVDVAWGDVNRLRRGTVDLAVGGGPDILHAVYGELEKDGRLKGIAGDSYILLVQWDKDGNVSSQSMHQFGSATLGENSAHYADQAPLFARRELKPVWLDEVEIRQHLEREYQP